MGQERIGSYVQEKRRQISSPVAIAPQRSKATLRPLSALIADFLFLRVSLTPKFKLSLTYYDASSMGEV